MSNLVGFVEKLPAREQMILVFAINTFGRKADGQMHRGVLPFVDAGYAIECLEAAATAATKGKGTYGNLADKLKDYANVSLPNTITFKMYLDDRKVSRRFGSKPHLGVPLKNAITRVEAGLKWSLPKRDYVRDDDVNVPHMIVLKAIQKGLWQVSVAARLEEYVKDLLMTHCSRD